MRQVAERLLVQQKTSCRASVVSAAGTSIAIGRALIGWRQSAMSSPFDQLDTTFRGRKHGSRWLVSTKSMRCDWRCSDTSGGSS